MPTISELKKMLDVYEVDYSGWRLKREFEAGLEAAERGDLGNEKKKTKSRSSSSSSSSSYRKHVPLESMSSLEREHKKARSEVLRLEALEAEERAEIELARVDELKRERAIEIVHFVKLMTRLFPYRDHAHVKKLLGITLSKKKKKNFFFSFVNKYSQKKNMLVTCVCVCVCV